MLVQLNRGVFGSDRILVETFRVQILLTNVSGDESQRLYKTICLLNWILNF